MTLVLKRDLMLISGGRLATTFIALITMRAVTTLLTPEQYGELALLITVQMFCGLFLVNPVGQHINLHTHAWWDDGSLIARLRSYRTYILIVSLIGATVALCVGKHQSFIQFFWTAVTVLIMVMAGTWNATLIPMLNMLGFRGASVLWSIVTVAISLASSILLVICWPSAVAWFAGQAIGMGVGALGAKYVLLRHSISSKPEKSILPLLDKHVVLTYCLPLAFATGLMWLQLSGYRFVIENYWGLVQLGFFAVGLQLAGQIWALAESLSMQLLYPLFYRRVSENEKQVELQSAVSDLLNTLVPVYFLLAGFTIVSAPYLLKLLVAPQFFGALNFVMLGAGIELCRVLGNLLSTAAHVRRKTKSLALPYAVGSATAIFLICIVGELKMEISWAGAALMVGAIAMFITMLISMFKQVNFSLDVARCVIGIVIMFVTGLLVIWIPKNPGFSESIGMLVIAGIFVAVIMLALLWKNPATLRMLNVQLRKK